MMLFLIRLTMSDVALNWFINEATGERVVLRNQQGEDWKKDSACKDSSVKTFFLEKGSTGVVRAREICADCPVRVDCLDYALRHGEKWGIWGGLTSTERRPFRRLQLENPEQDLKPIWQKIF